jgi:hypothetical protein
MALSAKMLAVLQKVDAAREDFFAGLRESAKQEAQVRVERKKRMTNAKKKPPMKMPPLRVTSTGGATHKPHNDRKGQIPKPRV